jgi:hypothetical protein
MHVSYRGEQLADFGWGGTIAKGGRPFGAEGIDGADFLMENIAIEEDQGAEGLVLGRGGNAGGGQLGEERLNLLFGGLVGEDTVLEKEAVTVNPVGVGFPSAEREVFSFASFYC